jgi:hypothetical protein
MVLCYIVNNQPPVINELTTLHAISKPWHDTQKVAETISNDAKAYYT